MTFLVYKLESNMNKLAWVWYLALDIIPGIDTKGELNMLCYYNNHHMVKHITMPIFRGVKQLSQTKPNQNKLINL